MIRTDVWGYVDHVKFMKKITVFLILCLNKNASISEVDGENYFIRFALIWKQKTYEVYMYGNKVNQTFYAYV